MSRPLRNHSQGFIAIRPSPGFYELGRGFDEEERAYAPPEQDHTEQSDQAQPPEATSSKTQGLPEA